jgi:hypothetical protein
MRDYFTTADTADLLGVETWRVRRLFEDGTLHEPERFGNQRAIPKTMLPTIIDRLRERGWLPQPSEGDQVGAESEGEPRA